MSLKDLTLREKVYRTIIIRDFQMGIAGTMKEFFEKYPVGGFYYHKGPAEGLIEMQEGEATPRRDFIEKCRKAASYPLVVCADGANIGDNGLDPLTAIVLGGTHSEELAYNYGKCLGMQMNANGVDWLLGPCVDMAYCRNLSSSSGQPMSNDAEYAAKMFAQVVKGLQSQNVAATVKHFPGVGTHHINFHISHGHNVFPFDKWMETYGKVYSEVFKAGSMSVMTSHLTLKSYSDKADYGDVPIATYSKDLTIGLLKEKLGFDGAVVTDALTMGGKAYGDQVEEAVAAFACGADFLLWPPVEAGDRIVEEIEKGNIPMSRLDDAIERIERFYERLGIVEKTREFPEVDAKYVDDTFKEIVKKSTTLVKNERGIIPIDKNKKKVLVNLVSPKGLGRHYENAVKCTDYFAEILNKNGFETEVRYNFVEFWEDRLGPKVDNFDYIINLVSGPLQVDIFPDSFNSVWTVHLLDKAKKILVNFSTPFFLDDYFVHEQTVLQLYGGINDLNVEAAADAILGKAEMTGKLPYQLNI